MQVLKTTSPHASGMSPTISPAKTAPLSSASAPRRDAVCVGSGMRVLIRPWQPRRVVINRGALYKGHQYPSPQSLTPKRRVSAAGEQRFLAQCPFFGGIKQHARRRFPDAQARLADAIAFTQDSIRPDSQTIHQDRQPIAAHATD